MDPNIQTPQDSAVPAPASNEAPQPVESTPGTAPQPIVPPAASGGKPGNKLLLVLLAGIFAVVLLAAGITWLALSATNDDSSSKNQEDTGYTPKSKEPEVEIDTSTVTGFLSQYGLVEADIKPVGAGEGKLNSSENSVIYTIKDLTEEQIKQWVLSTYDRLASISDDKKVYEFDESSYTEIKKDNIPFYSNNLIMFFWNYKYKGDNTYLHLSHFG
ncbi:MAG: hypothetical protein LBL84_02535, partial [Candidatus Nomurabacteria bacterium]|nr:hypothetical protein [Candidatus Nomurabacteria bacterium]